jgi:hypothetical protein
MAMTHLLQRFVRGRPLIQFSYGMVQQQPTTQVMLLLQFWQECCSGYDLAAKVEGNLQGDTGKQTLLQ